MKDNRPMENANEVVIKADHDELLLDVKAKYKGRTVGHAGCVIQEGGRLLLGDITVENAKKMPISFPQRVLCWLHLRSRTTNFRHMGIGTMIIQALIAEAKAAGIREIFGSVTQDDIDNTPGLLDWYGRMGFIVMEPDGECIGVKKIVMKLEPAGRQCKTARIEPKDTIV